MRGSILVTLFATLSIFMVSAQTPSNSIVIDPASFRPIQTDALTGIAIDPIPIDGSKRPCTRLKMRINRMTREEIGELSFRLRGGVIDLRKCQVAHEGNGLIIEMTAHANTRFYLHHERFGSSNEVCISTEGNKEYEIKASLNQFYPITIASNAADVDVYIDDTFVGRTNAENMLTVEEVLPGQHVLRLEHKSVKYEQKINIHKANVYFRQNVSINKNHNNSFIENADCNLNIKMIFVKGGTFTMGATDEQGNDAENDEKPNHSVNISDFYIGNCEITQVQWTAIMGCNPSNYKGSDHPVECVSWKDVQDFIKRLNQRTGKNYRLPTEAEWEYAARGGSRSQRYKYSGSNDINEVSWYGNNSDNKTHPVGQKQPNELGLYDMSGNVYEWCQDWFISDFYKYSHFTNPIGPCLGYAKVCRGGCYFNEATHNRISFRGFAETESGYTNIGFRLVLDNVSSSIDSDVNPMLNSSEFCEMVFVKGGSFEMGATYEQKRVAENHEYPVRNITVSDFYIGKYEVTESQWNYIMKGVTTDTKGGELPIDKVSWYDIQDFLKKLNQKTGKKYRLPTEAEWEYAARGGNKSKNCRYSGSHNVDKVAWYYHGQNTYKIHPVGRKQPNELGIYDMSGNVYEWCNDWYDLYDNSDVKLLTNPTGPTHGIIHVIRGGGYFGNWRHCRVSSRNDYPSGSQYAGVGFRLVLEP